jgi:CheY-like chemotaxis protein
MPWCMAFPLHFQDHLPDMEPRPKAAALIDRDIHLARALLVDGNAMMRNVTAAQLRDAGVGQVQTAGRVKEARLMLEREHFDIVLCTTSSTSPDTGQDLLDELRRENLLPHSTVFLMVAEKATYHQVVEAAESALDGLLVRPFTAALLCQRLLEARNRKRQLGDVLRALDAGQTEVAFARALKRFNDNLPYGSYCGRLAAELLLTMQRPRRCAARYSKNSSRPPVSPLGSPGRGPGPDGRRRPQRRPADHPGGAGRQPDSADAHDLIGRILVEQCDFEGALREYRAAASLTPGCLLRGQHAGALAFYQGANAEALERLEHTLGLGVQSKLFDALSLVLIALLRFDAGDVPGVLRHAQAIDSVSAAFSGVRAPAAAGTGRQGCWWTCNKAHKKLPLPDLGQLSLQVGSDDFDLESANVLISLWSRVPDALVPAAKHEALVERIAMRFCTSKAIGEVLVGSARRACTRRSRDPPLPIPALAPGRAGHGSRLARRRRWCGARLAGPRRNHTQRQAAGDGQP